MSNDSPLPPYPPARVWSFPPPPVRRRWFWVALTSSILATASVAALVVATAATAGDDAPGLIQDTRVLGAIDTECASMTDLVESYPLGDSSRDLAAAIRDQNRAVTSMIDTIAELPASVLRDDDPTLAWLGDWRSLVEARAGFADRLDEGLTGDFDVPRDGDGRPIDERMHDALLDDVCEVPPVLLNPRGAGTSSI